MIRAFKKLKTRGAVAPSSPQLIKKMLAELDFSEAKLIVEFGIGDGCFTEQILEKMRPDARLICFEIDPKCCEIVRNRFKDDRLVLLMEHVDESRRADVLNAARQCPRQVITVEED